MILSDPNIITFFVKNIFQCLTKIVDKLEDISDVSKKKIHYKKICNRLKFFT